MKWASLGLRSLAREWRSGELLVLLIALLVGVTSLSSVAYLTSRIGVAVARQAGEVLAADLVYSSGRELPGEHLEQAEAAGLATAQILGFPSVAWLDERSALASIKAVSAGYPLRGRIRLSDAPFMPGHVVEGLPGTGEVWVEARLLARLDAGLGSTLAVGAHRVRVTGIIDYLPDQGFQFVDLAPTLLMNLAEVPATELVQPESRVSHRLLLAGEPGAVRDFRERLSEGLQPGERLRGLEDARPEIRVALRRAEQFLGLAAMVSTLLCSVALAMAARRYAVRHLDVVALMKCMGARQGEILRMIVFQLSILALAGGLLGSLLGYGVQAGLSWLLRDLLDASLPAPGPGSFLAGPGTAVLMVMGFALPPLMQLRRVPPARVLRRNLEPPLRYLSIYVLAATAMGLGLLWLLRDPRLMAYVAVGLAATVGALWGLGSILILIVGRLRSAGGAAWRFGLANIARRGTESVIQMIAFGLGLMVLILLGIVRGDLLDAWRATLPVDAPNNFLINIQPHETGAVERILDGHGIGGVRLWPMVRARLKEIGGTPVAELEFGNPRAERFVQREANLSWSADLQDDNRIVAGQWWGTTADGGEPRVSVEEGIAAALGVGLGDRLGFDIAGEMLEATVTSIRSVEWDSFRPNFFLLLSPGSLEGYQGTYIGSVFATADQRHAFASLARELPGVTVIDIEAILAQVRGVMDKAALAVQAVFLLTLVAGVLVLFAAVQASGDVRRYEGALLRAMGARRRMVLGGIATEFVVLGLLSGTLGALGASIASYLIGTELLDLSVGFDVAVWLVGLAAGAVLVGVSGTLAARSAVNHPPVATLRAERG